MVRAILIAALLLACKSPDPAAERLDPKSRSTAARYWYLQNAWPLPEKDVGENRLVMNSKSVRFWVPLEELDNVDEKSHGLREALETSASGLGISLETNWTRFVKTPFPGDRQARKWVEANGPFLVWSLEHDRLVVDQEQKASGWTLPVGGIELSFSHIRADVFAFGVRNNKTETFRFELPKDLELSLVQPDRDFWPSSSPRLDAEARIVEVPANDEVSLELEIRDLYSVKLEPVRYRIRFSLRTLPRFWAGYATTPKLEFTLEGDPETE